MVKAFIKLVIGDLDAKRDYRKLKHRVAALPRDYRYAFRKIRHYIYQVGFTECGESVFTEMTLFHDLVELFETCVAEGRELTDVIGTDIAGFSDEFMRASTVSQARTKDARAELNREILDQIRRSEDSDD